MSVLFGRKGRRAAALGAAGLGACAALAACAPVQVGSAAIVGDQRITVSSLDTQVSNWETAAKPFGHSIQVTSANAPSAVLSWLIRFAVMNQVAAANGISVTQAQSQAALSSLTQVARQDNFPSASQLLIANGVPPQLFPEVGQWEAQQTAYVLKANGGKEPSSTDESNQVTAAITKAQCTASKALNIQVSPQFGRLDYTALSVVPAAGTLSAPDPVTSPSPAPTEGLTPAC